MRSDRVSERESERESSRGKEREREEMELRREKEDDEILDMWEQCKVDRERER